jgi:hypothetical protein
MAYTLLFFGGPGRGIMIFKSRKKGLGPKQTHKIGLTGAHNTPMNKNSMMKYVGPKARRRKRRRKKEKKKHLEAFVLDIFILSQFLFLSIT